MKLVLKTGKASNGTNIISLQAIDRKTDVWKVVDITTYENGEARPETIADALIALGNAVKNDEQTLTSRAGN